MINNFEVKPEEVLKEFYKNCYAPQEVPGRDIEEINHQLLLDDLQELQSSQVDSELLKKIGKICILHGSDDHIVPKRKGREIYTRLGENSRYFEIKGAGHALPFTHHQQCLDFIIPEIEELIKIKA
jgi:pimeloyl-[acyl-carrier protein] methyl ester esterase